MPLVSFTERDLKFGTIVTPAWYQMKIEEVTEDKAANGKSINYPVEATILKDADTGSEEFAGVPIKWNFNSKAIGFLKGLFAACDITPEAGKRYDLANFSGTVVEVYVENDIFENRTVNRVNHKYRKVTS